MWVLSALLWLAPSGAGADVPVVVVVSEDGERLAQRLAAELRARGYETHDESGDVVPSDVPEGADALAVIDDAPPRARLCVRDVGCEALQDSDANVLLIRAVETLRARLDDPLRVVAEPVEPEPVEPEPPEPEPAAEAVAPAEPPVTPSVRAELIATASGILPTSDLAFGVSAQLLLHVSPDPWLALELGGASTLFDPRVETSIGGASVATRSLWLGAFLRIPESVLGGHRILLGGGVGLANLDVRADALPPFEARSSSTTGALALGSALVSLHLWERVSLLLGGRVGVMLPVPVLRFASTDAARPNAPLVTLDLGVAVDFSGP